MIRTVCTEPGTIPYTGVNLKYPDFPSTDDTTGNPVYGLFRLSADPNTGSISNPFENDFYSPVIIEDLSIANSALAMNSSGYLYYFKYNPDYSISIGSIKSSPIIDLTDNAIRYPNLLAPGNTVEGAAIDVNGMGWAILADKSFITFQTTLSGGVSSIPNINGNIVPDDGLTSYRIEDIAFDASNNMYLLVREFNNFTTNIYYIPSGDIQQAGAGTTLTMKKLWTIQIPNLNPDNESAAIEGLALSVVVSFMFLTLS